jgi:RNA ligase (TIGR02306 family)
MDSDTRKLATIRKISAVEAIEGADNIEKILIDGWQCVCKKGEFKPGDLCVYFEIDSFLPIRPEFEFLRKSSYRKMGDKEGFRLRTIKLRKTLSQGLALSFSIFFEYWLERTPDDEVRYNPYDFKEGDNVTDYLGVILFEQPIHPSLQGKATNWPSFLRKTNQERVQNIWHKIKDSDELFEATLKMDGMSCTYYLNDDKFGVCSRNWEIIDTPGNTLWEIAKRYDIEQILSGIGKNIALQGEVVGEGIQNNPHGIKGQDFYLFDIWDIDKQSYLSPGQRGVLYASLATGKINYFNHVQMIHPCVDIKTFFKGDINLMLEYADGILEDGNGRVREGIVFKSRASALTFKVISNNYLLAQKE